MFVYARAGFLCTSPTFCFLFVSLTISNQLLFVCIYRKFLYIRFSGTCCVFLAFLSSKRCFLTIIYEFCNV
ncbi:hypothetical protein EG68_11764 [Paragonimus skrjabini miyazakii]|uniref:Uncharacterized protein n=1 Tax=Paragonimus skrjabini miyazakii TaxID=59628 RepID=A0A8S9YP49_9TREM|nr:hypothetical protein EG68_11764 [Paragonimus skrjabini miyazakii]